MAKTTQRSPTGRRRTTLGPPRWLWIAGPLVAVAAVAGFYAVKARVGGDGAPVRLEAVPNAAGVVHIHGLAVNPANGYLYAATHGGVFRINKEGKATRIANRYQDTMGFTIIGPDHFLASGHPDLREDLPPLLGLLESRDGAKTWTKKSLAGRSDFHVLRYAHKTIYGYDSTGSAFMVSRDGRDWETRSKTTLRDFAISPSSPDVVLATTPDGLNGSADGGRTWSKLDGPAQPVLLDWEVSDRLWLLDYTGQIHLSTDGGTSLEARGRVSERPEAFDAAGEALYAATGAVISSSKDEGRTWDVFYREGQGH